MKLRHGETAVKIPTEW